MLLQMSEQLSALHEASHREGNFPRRWVGLQYLFSLNLQQVSNGAGEVRQAFRFRSPLTVRPRDFEACGPEAPFV